ncbi:MAG: hypothetical protein A2Y40_10705 [Candidatus Margulisbacteria bacterium GWF2_35_9]|nr:MAG: hypothetical protein A2Y40_10705 [Candidatus Margulisbacteria bacterium GWF2_35_9]
MAKVKKSKRFNYNLASVLKVRKIREILQKEEVSKAIKKLKEEQEKQRKIEEEQEAEHHKIIEIYESGKAIDLDEIFLRKHHLTTLKIKFDKQVIETEKAERNKKEEDKKLLQAVKDKKILEKDKEKKRLQWKKVMEKEDVKFLDDISVSRFFRNISKDDE